MGDTDNNDTIFRSAAEKLSDIDRLNSELKSGDNDLRREQGVLCSILANEIRKLDPNLYLGLDKRGSLKINFRNGNKSINIWPDIRAKQWRIGDNRFERKFARYHGHVLELSPRIISKSIVEFFRNNYKSLSG